MDISNAKRWTNLEVKLLKVRHMLQPKEFLPCPPNFVQKLVFLDMCGLPLVKFAVADHEDGHDVKLQKVRTKKTNPLGEEAETFNLATSPCKEWENQVTNEQRKEKKTEPHATHATLIWRKFRIPSV